ncbi:hypothetical protein PR048_020777 [Dryococelus australis]|uniref:DDE Tnp4 domain-containing protein n=1 Tax=Dryococelus australis TaxID=614101 RepID=A0ABQ9GWC9_9NEOP|nr:hypothetical protein PR048_020777 [Dryococelus australis]
MARPLSRVDVVGDLRCAATSQDSPAWKEISTTFEIDWNVPHCAGALDGKHVLLQALVHSGSDFYNYKSNFSIVLLALVDGLVFRKPMLLEPPKAELIVMAIILLHNYLRNRSPTLYMSHGSLDHEENCVLIEESWRGGSSNIIKTAFQGAAAYNILPDSSETMVRACTVLRYRLYLSKMTGSLLSLVGTGNAMRAQKDSSEPCA